MEEDQKYERFDLENDFEGGQFIGDEFYFSKQKRKRQQTKHESIYGYETDSDEEEGRRRGPRQKADYTKPVGFVSSGITGGTADPPPQDDDAGGRQGLGLGFQTSNGRAGLGSEGPVEDTPAAAGEEEDEQDVLPGAFGRRIMERAREREMERAKERDRAQRQQRSTQPTKRGDTDIGNFEQHTKGIGEKLLMSMGWQKGTGLGRNKQGIAKPIEAKLRPKGMGMGFNDYDEHKLIPPAEEEKKAPEMVKEKVTNVRMWKKKHAAERVRRDYRTADEVLKEASEKAVEAPRQTILDMRGPQARLITNLEHLNVEETTAGDEAIPMPELQHNLRLLVDLAEADIQRIDGKLRQEKDTAVILGREQQRMEEEVEAVRQQVEHAALILEEVQRCQSGAAASSLADKEQVYRSLKARYREEYILYNLADAALSQVMPAIAALFQGWRPLQEPGRGVAELLAWRDLLESQAQRDAIFKDVGTDGDAYARLISAVVLPKVASAVTNDWEPRDCEPMLQWVEGWTHLLPASLLRHILHNLVFPKLRRAVEAWEPRNETVPLHAWLHPWLPFLGDQLQDLYPGIRFKLAAALQHWDPDDMSALALLQPWRTVFETKEWDALMGRSILPKLAWALDNRFAVNPIQQDLAAWNSVMAWAGVMAPAMLAGLLESRFFPKWHAVLHIWLSNMPDYDEVTVWYRGWKSLVPGELQDHERVRGQFNAALDMINTSSMGNLPPQYAPPPMAGAHGAMPDYAAGGAYVGSAATAEAEALTVRQLVENYAAEHNIEFLPKVGRAHNGLQVYAFGSVSIVMDSANDVVKAQLGERWVTVSLQTLLVEHQKRAAARTAAR